MADVIFASVSSGFLIISGRILEEGTDAGGVGGSVSLDTGMNSGCRVKVCRTRYLSAAEPTPLWFDQTAGTSRPSSLVPAMQAAVSSGSHRSALYQSEE